MYDHQNPVDTPDSPDNAERTDRNLTDAAKLSMQGEASGEQKSPEPPPGHQPAYAHGEIGNARRAETGPEKPEVKRFGPTEEEVKKKAQLPEGWRPGGPEHGG
jgi:hypothetical protein